MADLAASSDERLRGAWGPPDALISMLLSARSPAGGARFISVQDNTGSLGPHAERSGGLMTLSLVEQR